jgi:hypothetical protein
MPRPTAGWIARRIALVVGAILVVLAALEVTLRWQPLLLGQAFANGALSRYHAGAGGIYYHDPALGVHFMIPNHRATMYFNGYVWKHETDALGFRNRPLHVPADVVLLGDSVVYGHGVDFEHTIGHYLEQRSGLRVANLGRQGDSAFQEAYLLTEYLPVFKPRVVVHVYTPNDIADLYVHLTDARMEAFLARPVDRITFPARTDPATLLAERDRSLRKRGVKAWTRELYVAKMLRWLRYSYRQWRGVAGVAVANAAARPDPSRVDPARVSVDPESLGWRYTAHALAYMKHLADRAGARFLMAPMAQGRQLEILRSIAARHGIDLVDPGPLVPLYVGPLFLPNDGHLTPEGARTMAGRIAAAIADAPPAATGPPADGARTR